MSAELLRRAAEQIRIDYRTGATLEASRKYNLAIADWLEDEAAYAVDEVPNPYAVTVARAYLEETA